MLLACVMLFSVLVAPEVEAKEETVTQNCRDESNGAV